MCDFPSWIETKDGNIFLTDKDIEQSPLLDFDDDCVGHDAILRLYPNLQGKHGEDFPCPPDIAKMIRSGKMNRMMKRDGYEQICVDKKGRLHRDDDEPSMIYIGQKFSAKFWYKNGKCHREDDKPAVVYSHGTKRWFKNGKKHREGDLPAEIYSDGSKYWYKNNKIHRDVGPARIDAHGRKVWYKNNIIHRKDGPAIIDSSGEMSWWIKGKKIREEIPETRSRNARKL